MVFVNGKVHKVDQVKFNIPVKDEKDMFMNKLTFSINDGRFEMDFGPVLDRNSYTSVGIISSDQHQVFGKFSGKMILDNGEVMEINEFMGFAEKVINYW